MIIKKGFQFLNSFSLSLKQKVVLFAGQCLKIHKPIIRSNTIKMVDNPSIWQKSIVSFFPNKAMFRDITLVISSWMGRGFYANITTACYYLTTLPVRVFIKCKGSLSHQLALTAPSRASSKSFPAVYTVVGLSFRLLPHPIQSGLLANYSFGRVIPFSFSSQYVLPFAIWTQLLIRCLASYFLTTVNAIKFIFHTHIIHYPNRVCQVQIGGQK